MTSFLTRVAQTSLKSDFSKMRKASAFRRGLVVFVVTLSAFLYSGTATASHVAIVAMFVGQLDRGGSPRQLWHWMAGATVLMTAVSTLAYFLAGHFAALLVILAFIAFCAGASIGVNSRMPAVLIYTSAVLAAALIQPIPEDRILSTAIAVFLAGAIQTLLTALTAPVLGDLPERRAVALALRKLGNEFLAISRGKESLSTIVSTVPSSLTGAEEFIRTSDIAGDARRRFFDILATADLLSREARSYYARARTNIGHPTEPVVLEHFELVGQAVFEASQALEVLKPESYIEQVDQRVNQLNAINDETSSVTAQNIAAATAHLASSVKAVMEDPDIHRGHRERSLSLGNRIRASVAPGSIPLKHGLRLASAAVVGMVVSQLLGLNHGSWVAVTMIMLLRPDAGPALTRFVSRSIGNILGACIVVAVAFLVGGNDFGLIVAIGVSSTILFTVMPVNYTWAAMCSSSTAIFALTIAGEQTVTLAINRLTDVLVGCILGVAWAFMFPIWQRANLPDQCTQYLLRTAKWIKTCSRMAALDPVEREALIEKARKQATRLRASRQSLSATYDTSLVEPPTKQVDLHAIGSIMRNMRECNTSMVAAEHLLAHGFPRSKKASNIGRATAKEVRRTARLVVNPQQRDTLTKTFDDLEIDMSETGSLQVLDAKELAAQERQIEASRQASKKIKKKPKPKKKQKQDLITVMTTASKSAHRAYRAADSSKLNYDTFM
ncbi:MAG: FUSC family protein [Candidatus Nanopelagicales bacterium]